MLLIAEIFGIPFLMLLGYFFHSEGTLWINDKNYFKPMNSFKFIQDDESY